MDEVEFHVAATFDQLGLSLLFGPGLVQVPSDDTRINIAKRATHILRECKIRLPISSVEIIKKNTANTSCLASVRKVEIVIAPGFELGIIPLIIKARVV